MIRKLSRRLSLKLLALGTLLGFVGKHRSVLAQKKPAGESATGRDLDIAPTQRLDQWDRAYDRVFLGGDFWANPMEDWHVAGGWAECLSSGAQRSVHSLTHQITNPEGRFTMSVRVGRPPVPLAKDTGAGFKIGILSDIAEHRSSCFTTSGLNAGVIGGEIALAGKRLPLKAAPADAEKEDFLLKLTGKPEGAKMVLTLTATAAESGAPLGTITNSLPAEKVLGNVALVSQYIGATQRRPESGTPGYRFREWAAGGDAFTVSPAHRFGPILWSMYSLSDSRGDEGFVLKLSALTGPMGADGSQDVELQVQRGGADGAWESLGSAKLDTDAWVATFRIPHWDETQEATFKLVYREKHRDGTETPDEWTGSIKANPFGRPLRLGALTCQNDYAFPYAPVAENLVKLDPDMLYFSGDQLYEGHGGFGIIREPAEPAILCYLRKFYQFGWAFREAMRGRPTLCIPDDHDVFQANLWGEGGALMKEQDSGTSSYGGYIEPVRMINAVHKTNAGHHPDPYDANPCARDISVYYGDVVYGGVNFAVVADRQWKSGPEHVDTGEGRPDHIPDPDFDTAPLDKRGLILLGERQEEFLRQWAADWRGHSMKVVLSQTVFSGLATHHGEYDGYLKGDLDSGAWPQTARNRAIDILRSSMALHINGDQHLTTLSQYGVKGQRDSNWSFCTPAIAAGYPRWWRPDEVAGMDHQNRPAHGLPNTGEYLDGFGNKTYVYAVGNPEVGTEKNRYQKAHQKGSGFGLVTIDTEKKTYAIESFRFLIDATDGNPENQFPGWPVTLAQAENKGENLVG